MGEADIVAEALFAPQDVRGERHLRFAEGIEGMGRRRAQGFFHAILDRTKSC